MRRASSVAVLWLLAGLLTGCQLNKSSNDCVSQPGMTTGSTSVCTKPPPPQFTQLGN